ncbi:MAG: hypothetical protein MJZ41_17215, partial [Bacteroidaceae bacterium]|nr:hypothetical protein [Bacteroidaceae bacterium]
GASSSGRALSTLVEFDADYIAVYEDYSGEQKHVKRNQKYKVPLYAYIGYNDDTLYNPEIQNTNFKKEIERFFREHETIFVDDEGNYTIGKDIKGTFAHNSRSASGKFIINTSYEFEEKSIQEFISAWKSAELDRMINIMLNGTINHQIECDYVITRNADGTVYQIDYQGEGTFDLVANGVKRFHRDFGEIPYFSVLFYYDEDFLDITEDNLTVGPLVFYQGSGSRRDAANYTDEHGRGTVKLQYTKKIKVNK